MHNPNLEVRKWTGASGAEHQNRLRRKTVFDGSRHGYAGGLVNKFPVHRQSHASRFAPFVWSDTKASRKFTKPEWPYPTPQSVREEILSILLILSKKTLRSPCVPFACPNLVSIRGSFVSVEAGPRSGAEMARPCAGACPQAHGRTLPHGGAAVPCRRRLSCFAPEAQVVKRKIIVPSISASPRLCARI